MLIIRRLLSASVNANILESLLMSAKSQLEIGAEFLYFYFTAYIVVITYCEDTLESPLLRPKMPRAFRLSLLTVGSILRKFTRSTQGLTDTVIIVGDVGSLTRARIMKTTHRRVGSTRSLIHACRLQMSNNAYTAPLGSAVVVAIRADVRNESRDDERIRFS